MSQTRISPRSGQNRAYFLLTILACWMGLSSPVSHTHAADRIPVTTGALDSLGFFPVHSAPSTAVSINNTRISSEITGILNNIPVQIGEHVKAGALLARLDCEEHIFDGQQVRAMLTAARADTEFANFQLSRAQQLARTQAVSAEMLNEREANANRARAEVARLEAAARSTQRKIERCEIKAPFDAVVIERLASVGELMQPGMGIIRILDLHELEVSAEVQQRDLLTLQTAQEIRFVADNHVYPLELRATLPLVDARLRSVNVRFRFTDAAATPGQAGRVEWISHQLHIPADLTVRRGEHLGIFIEKDATAHFIPLPGAREGQSTPISLPADTQLILDGRHGLRNGDPINIISR